MADAAPDQDPHWDTGDGTSTPRWVKVFGMIALVVFLLFLVLMFVRGGDSNSG